MQNDGRTMIDFANMNNTSFYNLTLQMDGSSTFILLNNVENISMEDVDCVGGDRSTTQFTNCRNAEIIDNDFGGFGIEMTEINTNFTFIGSNLVNGVPLAYYEELTNCS